VEPDQKASHSVFNVVNVLTFGGGLLGEYFFRALVGVMLVIPTVLLPRSEDDPLVAWVPHAAAVALGLVIVGMIGAAFGRYTRVGRAFAFGAVAGALLSAIGLFALAPSAHSPVLWLGAIGSLGSGLAVAFGFWLGRSRREGDEAVASVVDGAEAGAVTQE
jgi:O-antigen/teichoic acid export membrane protein